MHIGLATSNRTCVKSETCVTWHYLRGLEPQLIKLEFIIYLPKLKVTAYLIKRIFILIEAWFPM